MTMTTTGYRLLEFCVIVVIVYIIRLHTYGRAIFKNNPRMLES